MVAHGSGTQLSQHALERLNKRLEPIREKLAVHPLYKAVQSVEDLRTLMQNHVFAVWDFMSLLKSLQVGLTCVEVPWVARGPVVSRRLVNEIVLGEESDEIGGRFISHLELYLESMEDAGACTHTINNFLKALKRCDGVPSDEQILKAATAANVPHAASQFVRSTFSYIRSGKLHVVASAFAFGREDLIPLMFTGLLKDMNRGLGGCLDSFILYLERHIEVDGEDHGPMSLQMMCEICGDDNDPRWDEAIETAYDALSARLELWDGVVQELKRNRRGDA